MRLAFLSTTVAPLGSGLGGGVELTVKLLSKYCVEQGHEVTVVAPKGSVTAFGALVEVEGECVLPAQADLADSAFVNPKYALVQACKFLLETQDQYDCIVSFSYDMLPLSMTDYFTTPMGHYISMSNENDHVAREVSRLTQRFPKHVAMISNAQMKTFDCNSEGVFLLTKGISIEDFPFNQSPKRILGWSGRVSEENGCEDALEIAKRAGYSLRLFGKIQDEDYWNRLQEKYADIIEYMGFLSQPEYGERLSECEAFLMTPKWIEAFGNVVVEALACGVPVITYKRGAPAELVSSEVGFVVPADSIDAAVTAVKKATTLSRERCRHIAEAQYSERNFFNSFSNWLSLFASVDR
jgi:UDP-glucose:tetrahydrobiopterin glucosyltransferase